MKAISTYSILTGSVFLFKGKISQISFSEIDLNNLYKVQVDQSFLQKVVYPMIKDNCVTHDEFFDKKPFPEKSPKRTNTYFVGQSYDEFNNPVYK